MDTPTNTAGDDLAKALRDAYGRELDWLRKQVVELCEHTEDEMYEALQKGTTNEHEIGFYKGRKWEAKGIRRAIYEVIRLRKAEIAQYIARLPAAEQQGASASQTGLLPDGPTASRSSGFAAAIPSRGPAKTFPIGFEDRIVTAVHPVVPDLTIVGWTFGDRDFGLSEVKRIALAALGTEAEGQDAEGSLVHEGPADLSATPEATPKSSPDQTPVDPQMTVEEARELLDNKVPRWTDPESYIAHLRDCACAKLILPETRQKLLAKALTFEAALRTLHAAGEVR